MAFSLTFKILMVIKIHKIFHTTIDIIMYKVYCGYKNKANKLKDISIMA